jgi:hypothetical protein
MTPHASTTADKARPRGPTLLLALAACLLLVAASPALGDEPKEAPPEQPKPVHWWEILPGVLAVPVALIGLVYTWMLIVKTRAEQVKLRLEIQEKERQLAQRPDGQDLPTATPLPTPHDPRVLLLLPRFIILFLLVQVFEIFIDLCGPEGVQYYLARMAYWSILALFGWPLFLDANLALGIDVKDYFRLQKKRPPEKPQGGP